MSDNFSFSINSECEISEESSGEGETEQDPSDPEDLRELHPGLLMYKASRARNLPVMAEAFANGANVNWVNDEDESKTPLIQAVMGVSINVISPVQRHYYMSLGSIVNDLYHYLALQPPSLESSQNCKTYSKLIAFY